jgi:hypothetical protein
MAQSNGDIRKKTCAVGGCEEEAVVEVILYDVYLAEEHVFFERDHTCPFLCAKHVVENERGAEGVRQPRGSVRYPFTNQEGAQGFTIYRPLERA